jgi:hypothetical protein
VTTSTRSISACGKVFTSTWPVVVEATERCPSNSTRVRAAPRLRRLTELMPAAPLLSEPLLLADVPLPRTAGSVLTKSEMLAGASAFNSLAVTTLTGVGALYPLRSIRDPVTTIVSPSPILSPVTGSTVSSGLPPGTFVVS